MNNQTFKQLYNQLNSHQKQAVDTLEGAVMVIAGPGTGKTQMLTLRIANILLNTQAQPENILALTFTEAGVQAMRQRLQKIIGPLAFRVNIYTFHSFCNYLIQTHTEEFIEYASAEAISEIEQIEILETIFNTNSFKVIKPLSSPYFYLQAAKSAISELKREAVTPDSFLVQLEAERQAVESDPEAYHTKGRYKDQMKGAYKTLLKENNKNLELAKVYQLYQQALAEKNLYDYEDMILTVIAHMMANPDFLLELQEQYQYFLIDEHQDTNAAQNKIVELLANFHPNPNLFAVGDEKQAIYRFQGASLNNFLYFRRLYPQAQVVTLESNYRSTQTILDAAHSLIENNVLPSNLDLPLRQELKAEASFETSFNLEIVDCSQPHVQWQWIVEDIQKAISQGTQPGEIAVLARKNRELESLGQFLAKNKLPFVMHGSKNILEDIYIKKFIKLLRSVEFYGEDDHLIPVLFLDINQIHPMDIVTLRNQAKQVEKSIWEVALETDLSKLNLKSQASLENLITNLTNWKNLSQNQTLDVTFATILKNSQILDQILKSGQVKQSLDMFTNLYHHLLEKLHKNPEFSLKDFLDYIDLLQKHNLKLDIKVNGLNEDAIHLMTAHGSKGLEFERVYLMDVYHGNWGDVRTIPGQFKLPYSYMGIVDKNLDKEAKNADERRLMYVALTRAKQKLTLTYAKQKIDGRTISPSQFISELASNLIDTPDLVDFETEFEKKRHQIFDLDFKFLNPEAVVYRDQLRILVNQLLDTKGFNVSSLNNYLSCPWKYFFRSLMRIPEAKNESAVFGSMIHEVINYYIHNRSQVKDLATIIKAMERYLKTQPLTKVQFQEQLNKGKELFEVYFPQKMLLWPENIKSETFIKGVGIEDVSLNGKLDMMIQTSQPNHYEVIDFKTSKPKSRNEIEGKTKNSTGDLKRQLVFYRLLLDLYKGGLWQMDSAALEFVTPDDKGRIKTEKFEISDDEVEDLKVLILETANQIRNLDFWDQVCDDQKCPYCQMRAMMV